MEIRSTGRRLYKVEIGREVPQQKQQQQRGEQQLWRQQQSNESTGGQCRRWRNTSCEDGREEGRRWRNTSCEDGREEGRPWRNTSWENSEGDYEKGTRGGNVVAGEIPGGRTAKGNVGRAGRKDVVAVAIPVGRAAKRRVVAGAIPVGRAAWGDTSGGNRRKG